MIGLVKDIFMVGSKQDKRSMWPDFLLLEINSTRNPFSTNGTSHCQRRREGNPIRAEAVSVTGSYTIETTAPESLANSLAWTIDETDKGDWDGVL